MGPRAAGTQPHWLELSLDRAGDDILVTARGSQGEGTQLTLSVMHGVPAMLRFADAVRRAAEAGAPLDSNLLAVAQSAQRDVLSGKIGPLLELLRREAGGRLLVRLVITDPELQAVPCEALCAPGEALGFWGTSA